MTYTVRIKKQAKKTLDNLPHKLKSRIAEKIYKLGYNPDDINLDVRPLTNSDFLRLRVGSWRIVFSKDDSIKVISIEKIKPRGDIYK